MSAENATKPQAYATSVRDQYEDMPYPHRDPEKEGEKFYAHDALSLDAYSHFGWAGKRNLRDGARILSAGCGTGDSAVFFAEQLEGSNGKLVLIDLSSASIAIAKARLEKRGLLDRVTFHHMSILDLPNSGLGPFDVIDCGGVLHHLPDPDAGLAALNAVLADDGIMGIMVYAQYGRMSIYLVQELMRRLTTPDMSSTKKVELTREFLNFIPTSHWLTVKNERFLEEIQWADGSGIFDLFLHSVDRAYTVPQIYDWVHGAGLQLLDFFSEYTDSTLYLPESYTPSLPLREAMAGKTLAERHAIAELMNGNIYKHYFYAAKQAKQPAALADDMIMMYGALQSLWVDQMMEFAKTLETLPLGSVMPCMPRPFPNSPPLNLTRNVHTSALLRLIDGKRTLREIITSVTKSGASEQAVRSDMDVLYAELRSRQIVFLRHQSVPAYPNAPTIIDRMRQHQAFTKR